jgi:hypothetical protein
MPKRVIDFDALWGSDKIAACAEWAQAEYAWLYGLADPSGCFELTNLRVIWGRVAAIRRNLTIERLEQVFEEFQDKGLLFVWELDGKRYGHWTGSDVPGRLPPPSWRMRLERLAPAIPKQLLAEYVSRFARGRAASPRGFASGVLKEEGQGNSESPNLNGRGRGVAASGAGETSGGVARGRSRSEDQKDLNFEISSLNCAAPNESATFEAACQGRYASGLPDENSGLKAGLEETHAQDLGLDLNWKRNGNWVGVAGWAAKEQVADPVREPVNRFSDSNAKTISNANAGMEIENANARTNANRNAKAHLDLNSSSTAIARESICDKAPAFKALNANANAGAERNEQLSQQAETARGHSEHSGQALEPRNECNRADLNVGAGTEWYRARRATAYVGYGNMARYKAEQLEKELRVGEGPSSFGPIKVKPEALERNRLRNARERLLRSG